MLIVTHFCRSLNFITKTKELFSSIMRVSKTHRNGFMDDLPTLPPLHVHFVKCLVVLRI